MKKNILLLALLHLCVFVFAQKQDSTKAPISVSGAIAATNNGISLVPTFSLGKPATIFDLAVRKKRFSFEPQLAFAFKEVKPWYFIFWLRYKLVETSKFRMGVGFHPGFVFSSNNLLNNGITKEYFTASRFFVGELSPSYSISKKVSVGLYYLHSRGFNSDLKQLNFVGFNTVFSNITLGNQFLLRLAPQIYYLKTDDKDGCYFTSTVSLSKKGLPFSLSSTLNKKVKSNIVSNDFVWNISLAYLY